MCVKGRVISLRCKHEDRVTNERGPGMNLEENDRGLVAVLLKQQTISYKSHHQKCT
jgi:hypothetical protein